MKPIWFGYGAELVVKSQFVFDNEIGLTAVYFITIVSTVTPAITLKFLLYALLVFALELVWTSCRRKNKWEMHPPKNMKKKNHQA